MLHRKTENVLGAQVDYWQSPVFAENRVNDNPRDIPDADDFFLLANYIPSLCWIAHSDGYIYWYNKRWHDYCGSTPEAMAGWGWHDVHDPLELQSVMSQWTQSISTGTPFEMIFPLRGADGIFRMFLTRIVPVFDQGSKVMRWLGTNTEVESQLNMDSALAASEAKFRTLTDAMPQMIWSTLPDGYHDYYNAKWYEFTGVPYGSTDGEGWNNMFHPDDQDRAWGRWRQCLETGDNYEIEYRLKHHSGQYRWTLGRALPVRNAAGKIIRWIGTCTDIHQSKLNADQSELMSRELSHRIKNIFAVIAGLIGLSAPKDAATSDFAKQLGGRISALGRAHNFARPHSPMSDPGHDFASMHGLLTEILSPYDIDGVGRYEIAGDDVPIGERSATPIALVVHELATNAVKYGALSSPGGRVIISTKRLGDEFRMSWLEKGGPRLDSRPEHQGFGTQLSEISITNQLGGTIERVWNSEGLEVIMTIRLAHL
jgi:PAS domain S-box-containing protein